MTLLIDVGNSAIKWAHLSADGELRTAQVQPHRDVVGIAARLADQWRGSMVQGAPVIACNVANLKVVAAVEEAARLLQLQPVRWLHTQRSFNGPLVLTNGYRNPEQLGADRWHCMLGACSTVNLQGAMNSIVVVNAGTATTVDCVDAGDDEAGQTRFTGKFVGGVIAPGVRLMLESLALRTAGLPNTDADLSANVADFPDYTDAAIVTGVLDAQAGLVYRIWHRFAVHRVAKPRLILTGGHAEALFSRLSMAADIEHNLVLRGLALRVQSDLSKEQ